VGSRFDFPLFYVFSRTKNFSLIYIKNYLAQQAVDILNLKAEVFLFDVVWQFAAAQKFP